MAKEGIDSFLLNCHTNDNISEIEAKFGVKGFAVVVRLWQKIYSEKGYYCEWVERSPLLFLAKWFGGNSGVTVNLITEIVDGCLDNGIFDKQMYEKYSILTSARIQKQYFDVVKRREEIPVVEQYLLISVGKIKGVACKNANSVSKTKENACRTATSKVKQSKVKGREENSARAPETSFNAEQAWIDTFNLYPKKTSAVMAKQVWMDKLLDVIETNRQDVAKLIYLATKLYLSDYDEKNPDDTTHRYIPKYSDWLVNDCDYWISEIEKKQRGDDN